MPSPTLNDRRLAARVRSKILQEIEKVLNGDDEVYKKELITKMATTILPRLQEVTGEDGEAIKITIAKEVADKYETTPETSPDSTGQPQI